MTRDVRALLGGAAAAAAAGLAAAAAGLALPAAATAAVAVLCAVYWVAQPIPLAATSLIPLALFPLVGAGSHAEVAAAQGSSVIALLMAGFMLSAAIEKSGAHRRVALLLVQLLGGSRRRVVLGFMIATAVISGWTSNAATTLMMLPVASAVVEGEPDDSLATPLFLGIAYAASIGGMATPVGTPPNLIFMAAYQRIDGEPYSFVEWMRIGVPIAAILIPLCAFYLSRRIGPGPAPTMPPVGPPRPAERRMLLVFALTAVAWVFRSVPYGGWAGALDVPGAGDSTVALCAVVILFIAPDGEGGRLLDWPTAQRIPWGLLLLFGGGIAIADAFERTGLSVAMADLFTAAAAWPTIALLVVICLLTTFLTELMSNTALATLLMPVLAAVAVAIGVAPALLMVPAAISASCSFMLPAATAPNAIVYGSGRVAAPTMARTGLLLNLAGAVVITLMCLALLA
jgi:solute carrier family 13 (sodium-dependent dicarboxylate transporter), member 2/3/5